MTGPSERAVETTLVTGLPSFVARRMVDKVLSASPSERVFALVRHRDSAAAEDLLSSLPPERRRRLTLLIGDVSSLDLGLSTQQYKVLTEQVSTIHHIAAYYHLGVRRHVLDRMNVGGTRATLDLALACRALRRFNFWSTVHVSGDREGVVMEDELQCGQRFRNGYEESKFAAELIVRQLSRRVPSTILRPGIIVGDSATGEIGPYDGPYQLISILMNGPLDLQLPLPGRGTGPLHLVPVDFVVDAAYEIGRNDHAVSKTFHLVDPAPLSARSIFELVAEQTERKVPRSAIPSPLAKGLLRLPWVGKMRGSPKTIMEGFNQQVLYNCRNTLEALRGTGVWCPRFDRYVDNLVRFLRYTHEKQLRIDGDLHLSELEI